MDDKAKKLYDNLTSDGYQLGSFDEFNKSMEDIKSSFEAHIPHCRQDFSCRLL